MKTNEQSISELAYQIWEAEGKPEGHAERHWTLARLKLAQTNNHAPLDNKKMSHAAQQNGAIASMQPDQT